MAALALGAAGVCVGTRFVVSEESAAHPIYKEKLLQSVESDTVYSSLFDGRWPDAPHRTLRNSTVAKWESAGRPPSGLGPGEGDVIATKGNGTQVLRYEIGAPNSDDTGDIEALPLWAGQGVGLATPYPAGRRNREGNREGNRAGS